MSSNKDDLFGGLFDWNGDGKTDLGEEFLAFALFESMMKEKEERADEDDYEDAEDYYNEHKND